jgi:hypothetical protein
MTYVWKQTILVLLVGFSIVMLAGYASAQSPTDVSGTWTGSTTRGAATYVLVLKQDGQKVTGTLSGAGTDDGPVTGTISGNTIRLKYDDGRETTPSLTVKGDQIEGVLSGGAQVVLRRPSK